MTNLFDTVRSQSREVMRRARSVHLDEARCDALAEALLRDGLGSAELDPIHRPLGSPEESLAYVVTLDAINFGSGWFPHLRKRPGCSGYLSIAFAWWDHFDREGAPTAEALSAITPERIAEILSQLPASPPAMELMTHFSLALRHLGVHLTEFFDGSFAALIESASGSGSRLVRELARMPYYRDVGRYEELAVPFYKRGQITVADLSRAFGGQGYGAFDDLAQLTCFADNLVPHVLRHEGVLRYESDLAACIEREELVVAGSAEEIEIRAAAVVGVAQVTQALQDRGVSRTEAYVDGLLWERGQRPAIKAHPRHRARCVFY